MCSLAAAVASVVDLAVKGFARAVETSPFRNLARGAVFVPDARFSSRMRVARDAEQKRWVELMANPSAALVEAYRELQAAEAASGARIGGARGGDMTDPKTVRALARLLSDPAEKFQ